MKKLISVILSVVFVLGMVAGCGSANTSSDGEKKMKVGFIFLHDENSTYDLNFINGAKAVPLLQAPGGILPVHR